MTIGERVRYLGTDRFTWWDLKVVVSQASESSPIVRKTNPELYRWGLDQYLLAEIADTLHWLQWAKTPGAQKRIPEGKPDPIPRPGLHDPNVEIHKFDVLPADEMMQWLGWDTPD